MNRPLIITIGIIVILLVLGVWIYLMLFGTPEDRGEVFANLGFELNSQETTITPPRADTGLPETIIDTKTDALRQLTTRPVAGFAFMNSSSSTAIRYIERGTGHMYEINLETGQEQPLSRTTVPKITEAVFSPDGNTVALTSYENYRNSVFVGTLGKELNITGIQLQPGADNISFASSNEILYSVSNNGTTKGYLHNLTTLAQSEQFSFNYTNLDVDWGDDLKKTYLSTKPSPELEGFIYTTENNILTPAMTSQYGLSALFNNDYILATFTKNNSYTSSAISETGEVRTLPTLTLKEKCVFDTFSNSHAWCASPITVSSGTFVEDWYKGTITSNDLIWLVDITGGKAQLYANLEALSGRIVDVTAIDQDDSGSLLSFTNKLDHTLWLFDLTVK